MPIPSDQKTSLSAIILAGGHSTRMGQDKALIEIEGVPLLQRTCSYAQAVVSDVYVVTPWGDRYQEFIECQIISELSLPHESPPHGPLVGLYQGMQQVKTPWVLALACDLPKLTVAELEFWVQQLANVSEDVIALIPRSSAGWEPLCGFYHQSCQKLLGEYINQGGRSFQRFLDQHSVAELTVRDRAVLFNCNTPQDLELL
ncbi:molybdenum cofactor guanylyltransferase [Halothece sp. PCC 7418]|uniref:molybdenum cofactor guanylyltransferase n=1 Tax=Halothece sp. (strain PCC 7418) TaxID=65093 RepID=UPI0002A0784C|nr:molybdenum cofactor guanylyltransferase [Halothece sp. PCC 7418]AFZ44068.1 molybdenum cofactor guanylyltransferase [Halothece sp. PCC 7418]